MLLDTSEVILLDEVIIWNPSPFIRLRMRYSLLVCGGGDTARQAFCLSGQLLTVN